METWLRLVAPDAEHVDRVKQILQYLKEQVEDDVESMENIVYELRVLYHHEAKKDMRMVAERVREGAFAWNHPSFEQEKATMERLDEFILKPPQIEEGVLKCKRCGSRRTFSFSKQTRRSDEAATVFVQCAQCSLTFRL